MASHFTSHLCLQFLRTLKSVHSFLRLTFHLRGRDRGCSTTVHLVSVWLVGGKALKTEYFNTRFILPTKFGDSNPHQTIRHYLLILLTEFSSVYWVGDKK